MAWSGSLTVFYLPSPIVFTAFNGPIRTQSFRFSETKPETRNDSTGLLSFVAEGSDRDGDTGLGCQLSSAPCCHQRHRVLRRQDTPLRRHAHHRRAADDGPCWTAPIRRPRYFRSLNLASTKSAEYFHSLSLHLSNWYSLETQYFLTIRYRIMLWNFTFKSYLVILMLRMIYLSFCLLLCLLLLQLTSKAK